MSELETGKRNDAMTSSIRAIAIALDTSMDYLCDRFGANEEEDNPAQAVAWGEGNAIAHVSS
jgi:hypothetical protein